MTAKRFIIMDNLPKGTHSNIWDKQKQHNQGIGDELWLGEVVAMLNEGVILAEENEQLKSENKQLTKEFNSCSHNWALMYDEAKNKVEELSKENKQLKETINELRDMDKEKDIEIEHINNIYKEFGFKGIIDYAKDKLQNYGIVREVDNGLWLLATGGWSDNEFWLDCLLNWNFMYAKGHYCAMTSGGGYYYTETPYEDIEIKKRQIKG